MRSSPSRRQRGFTLIEIAVVIVIAGLIAGVALNALTSLRRTSSTAATLRHHDTIADALRQFLVENNRLPCPALANLPETDPNYGQEAPLPGTCTGTVALAGATAPTVYYAGVVPWQTLGLQGAARFDGGGYQYSYAILDDATLPYATVPYATSPDEAGTPWLNPDFVLLNAAEGTGQPVTPGGEVVIVISHGINGSGAFNVDGAQLQMPPATALNELENLDGDITAAAATFSSNEATPFDDVVRGYTEEQLILPLIKSGALRRRADVTLERLEKLADVLLSFSIWDVVDPDSFPLPVDCTCGGPSASVLGTCAGLSPRPAFCTACLTGDNGCARTSRHRLPYAEDNETGDEAGLLEGNIPWRTLNVSGAEFPIVPTVAAPPPSGAIVDQWGNPIVYRVDENAALERPPAASNTLDGIYSSAPNVDAFILSSPGPNGRDESTLDTVGAVCGGDDLCVARSFRSLVGQMVRAGVNVD